MSPSVLLKENTVLEKRVTSEKLMFDQKKQSKRPFSKSNRRINNLKRKITQAK